MQKIRVLIVDDSASVRSVLQKVLMSDPEIEVVGAAEDPYVARELIKKLNPDVLTLDIEMPKMDGISFLRNLMRLRPMPVVMVSTLTEQGAPLTLEAIEIGAVDYIAKPQVATDLIQGSYVQEICSKVKTAANANVRQYSKDAAPKSSLKVPEHISSRLDLARVIGIGASTGGTEAVKEVLVRMPEVCPPIIISQHIPAGFSKSFAERVDSVSKIHVKEAEEGDKLEPGLALIAPGDRHLVLKRRGVNYFASLDDGERVNLHKPSVEVMFDSMNMVTKGNCVAAMLTGMGADGAQAMLRLKKNGVNTFAQDEATSVVWGMPGAAVKLGAVDREVALPNMTQAILKSCLK
ncbi:protein-glutamate methylesterase/protein-glutamine glutaminase [Litoribrevibacter albus]|uniref:Protein-glutamate methylesterase/protein-glutamine glutaminase n=1 Tax=Litoribrevibacter albus TaxID=1473156 RepID=A0AA37W8S4_9GAMM|nr:chemotaxis response regulator protein-glutamate methylesterase [Litoribrevibacter albus]GLQ32339.1 chemotaxis response regulator protein-glutamate methylesterase of group 1 operon [Litoribrevibacter albus]